MTATCIQKYIGQGRDNQGMTHKGYSRWIMQAGRRPKTKVSTWRDWMKWELLQVKTSNEVFLFHGTRHEYCRPDARGICSIFLVRAVLGMPYEAEQPMPNTRLPPASADFRLTHDSVIGVTSNTHPNAWLHKYREFILYDRRQTYPEFLIEFRRV